MKLSSKIFNRHNKAYKGNTPYISYFNISLMIFLTILKLCNILDISWWIITLPISTYVIGLILYILIIAFAYFSDKE